MNLLFGVVFVAALCGYTHGAKYCCYPPIWESLNFFQQGVNVNGTISSVMAEEMVSVDTKALMVNSMASYTSSGVTTSIRIIQDYNNEKQYQIIGDNCKVTTVGNYTNKCVPDDARFDVSAVFGVGKNQLTFDVFTIVRNGTTVSLDVAQPGCIPLAMNAYGSLGGGMGLASKTYTNFTLGIKDRSVFDIPSSCQKAPVVQLPLAKVHVEQRSLPEVHGVF